MSDENKRLMAEFGDAWNRHDVEALIGMMTGDCVMQMSTGPLPKGARFEGSAAIRGGIERMFAAIPDVQWQSRGSFSEGNRGVFEWVMSGTGPNGYFESEGCDILTFRDGKVSFKNSFRKQDV